MAEPCIRCGDQPGVDESGYCGPCHWAAHAEFESGFYALRKYLEKWDKFAAWLVAHGQPR